MGAMAGLLGWPMEWYAPGRGPGPPLRWARRCRCMTSRLLREHVGFLNFVGLIFFLMAFACARSVLQAADRGATQELPGI